MYHGYRSPVLSSKSKGGSVWFPTKNVTSLSQQIFPAPKYLQAYVRGAHLDLELTFTNSLVIVLGDFNKGNRWHERPKYKPFLKCPPREEKTLNQCSTTFRRDFIWQFCKGSGPAIKFLPPTGLSATKHPLMGKSPHATHARGWAKLNRERNSSAHGDSIQHIHSTDSFEWVICEQHNTNWTPSAAPLLSPPHPISHKNAKCLACECRWSGELLVFSVGIPRHRAIVVRYTSNLFAYWAVVHAVWWQTAYSELQYTRTHEPINNCFCDYTTWNTHCPHDYKLHCLSWSSVAQALFLSN